MAKRILSFVAHQLAGTIGVPFLTAIAAFSYAPVVRLAGVPMTTHQIRSALTETPYIPLQIISGLLCGFVIERRWRQPQMKWVWLLPLAILLGFFIHFPGSRVSHFFGAGCRPESHCFDQLGFTLPLYSSLAYSTGALLSAKKREMAGSPR
jgi:hypothetical protein